MPVWFDPLPLPKHLGILGRVRRVVDVNVLGVVGAGAIFLGAQFLRCCRPGAVLLFALPLLMEVLVSGTRGLRVMQGASGRGVACNEPGQGRTFLNTSARSEIPP
jgi:hypothetical protein